MQFWDKGPMVVTGCTKVSEGCKNCWSEKAHAMRCNNPAVEGIYSKYLLTDGRFNGKVQFNLRLLEEAAKGRKRKVIAIWNDLYHDGITDAQIVKAFNIMDAAPQHVFLIVTKRPQRAENKSPLLNHIWHIVTAENQDMADKRIPHLLRIPGKRGIIIEPMLEAMVLNWCGNDTPGCPSVGLDNPKIVTCDAGTLEHNGKQLPIECEFNPLSHLHQVILGPENGPGKRPFDPVWADSVKTQCEAAGVPFYRKDKEEGRLVWRRDNE